MATQPLVSVDATALRHLQVQEAAAELEKNASLRVLAGLLNLLHEGTFAWWTSNLLLGWLSVKERMELLSKHPVIRQQLTKELTNIPAEAVLTWEPSFQAELIERVQKSGIITEDTVNGAFAMELLVLYAGKKLWKQFREQMLWQDASPEHRRLVGALIELLLANENEILTPHAVLSAINRKVWQESIPPALRAQIDEALLTREEMNPGVPFLARDILEIVGHKMVAEYIPLTELYGVMTKAEEAMGFAPPKNETAMPPPGKPEGQKVPEPESGTASTATEGGTHTGQDVDVDLSAEELEALNAETGGSGDDTETFKSADLPKTGSTLTGEGFKGVGDGPPPSLRGDPDRSSSVGFSPAMMERFQPLLEYFEGNGSRLDGMGSLTPATELILKGLLVGRTWPKSANSTSLRVAFAWFVHYMDSNKGSESDILAKSPADLESTFFHVLIRVNPSLVKEIQVNKPARVVPPLRQAAK